MAHKKMDLFVRNTVTSLLSIVSLLTFTGCPGEPFIDHLSGSPLPGAPHFHHRELFVDGDTLRVAVDPHRYPAKVGDVYDIYVVEHKTYSQWSANPVLTDVSGGAERKTLAAGSLNNNIHIAWASMNLPSMTHRWHKHYDVAYDFDLDGSYDKSVDILDRIGILERVGVEESGGFTLIEDPTLTGDFPVSTHLYDFGNTSVPVPALYQEPGDPKTVTLNGKMYYPATSGGVDKMVNTDLAEYPLIIIAHGRHGGAPDSYLGYDYLGNHLASRGFVCASIPLHQLSSGWRIHHRGVTILKHLESIIGGTTSDSVILNVRTRINTSQVGLLGHSRGGEGVVAAQNIHSSSGSAGYHIRAVLSFSPTDGPNWSETSPGGGPYDPGVPYLMIYGTRDGDLNGYAGNTGFRLHDRAERPRHLIAVYGGNHNFFNDNWGSDGNPTITRTQQKNLAIAYVTPFFSNHLLGQQAHAELFSGYTIPPAVNAVGTTMIFSDQPERWVNLTVDDSQDIPAGATSNSLGVANTSSGVITFAEESLRYVNSNHLTHDTDGLRVEWGQDGGYVSFGLGNKSFLWFDYLNFRVGQRYRSSGNKNPLNQSQDFTVTLHDADGHSSPAYPVSVYTQVPFTDHPVWYPKSIMQTVRIPVRAFTANGSQLDIRKLSSIRFTYGRVNTGELIFDDVEFLGLDISEPVIPPQ